VGEFFHAYGGSNIILENIVIRKLKYFSIIFFIVSLRFIIPSFHIVLGDESEAISSISHAENSIYTTYAIVYEVERKGGDVSELIVSLNKALNNIAEAEIAFEAGNYNLAAQIADSEIEMLNHLSEEAMVLGYEAEVQTELEFRNKLMLSASSVFVILLSGYFGWRRFKEYYFQRLLRERGRMLESRLEVLSDEP
jgi:hypothetical protein